MRRACSTYGRKEKCIMTSERKGDRNRPLGIIRHKWECNDKYILNEWKEGA
jgi:hypothetical protein